MVSKSSLNQHFYTKVFLNAANWPLELANDNLNSWWWTPKNHNNLRLKKSGYDFVKSVAKITTYVITLEQPLLAHHLIKLARLNIGPYYVQNNNKLVILDEEVATMLTLHAGNLGRYLENLQL